MANTKESQTVSISTVAANLAKQEQERQRKEGIKMSLGTIVSKAVVDTLSPKYNSEAI